MRTVNHHARFLFLVTVLLAGGCTRREAELSEELLKNISYTSDSFDGLTVALKNGSFSGRISAEEPAEFEVRLLDGIARGSLEKQTVAAVLLMSNGGGSGSFVDLAIVASVDGKPENIATTNLGDRVRVNHVMIQRDTIMVDMITHGPEDALCCPTMPVLRKFTIRNSDLHEELPALKTGQDSDRDNDAD